MGLFPLQDFKLSPPLKKAEDNAEQAPVEETP